MKRVISSRLDDVMKKREEYETQYNAKKEQLGREYTEYQKDLDANFANIEYPIREKLGKLVNSLNIYIDVNKRFDDYVIVDVRSNEYDVHNKDKALSWNWEVRIDKDGSVVKDSGSWSGLNAVTDENIKSLRDSVDALEILNSLDWGYILQIELPDRKKYEKTTLPPEPSLEFKSELMRAAIEDSLHDDVGIRGRRGSGKIFRGDVFYIVLAETPKMIEIAEFSYDYYLALNEGHLGIDEFDRLTLVTENTATKITSIAGLKNIKTIGFYSYRTTKEKFSHEMISTPIEILE